MSPKLERQIEKEVEHFLEENWKIVLPIGALGGAGFLYKHYQSSIHSYFLEKLLPVVETGVITLGSISLISLTIFGIQRYIVRKKERENYTYFRVLPRANQDVNAKDVHQLMHQLSEVKRGKRKRLFKGREWFQWLIHRDNHDISFYIGAPNDQQREMRQAFQNAYPDGELHQVGLQLPSKGSFTGRMRTKKHPIKQWMPFTTYEGGDQVGNLLTYMPSNTWVSLAFSPDSRKRLGKKLTKAEKQMKRDKKYMDMYAFEKERFKDITNRFTGNTKAFQVVISIAGEGKKRRDIIKQIGRNISLILNNKNNLLFRRHFRTIKAVPHPRQHLLYLTNKELANILHLPNMNHTIAEHIPKLEKGQKHLAPNELSEGATVGYNIHPLVQEREVKISFSQLTEHFFVSGQTGSGKSSLLIMMLQSVIDQWLTKPTKSPGFTFLDPAGTTARTLLNRLQLAEQQGKDVPWDKVIYLSYKNGDHPIGLNLLHKNEWEDTDTVVQNAMGLFKSVYVGDRTRIDKYLSNALTALVDDQEEHTILGVNRFMTDSLFRNQIVNRMQDEILQDFWRKADAKEIKQIAPDIYSRVNNFEQSLFMRRLFGQPNWDLPLKRYMDEGYIVLMDIQGMGRINTKMITGHIINQYHQVCQKRKPYSAKEHFLITDEAHLIQLPTLEKIIAEDRKFGLCLGLSTQYLGQFEDWLQKAIDGNVQNIITGAQGGNESRTMADVLMKKQFDSDLIATLPNNHAAVLTKNADKTLTTCLVKSALPYLYKPDGSIAKHKDDKDTTTVENWIDEKAVELQATIGRSTEEIDQYINNYYGFDVHHHEDPFFQNQVEEEPMDKKQRQDTLSEEESVILEVDSSLNEENSDKEKKKEVSKVDSFF